jgi:hypothetical protein
MDEGKETMKTARKLLLDAFQITTTTTHSVIADKNPAGS